MIPLRDENPSFRIPVVTIGLIVLNSLVFLYELSLTPRVLDGLIQAAGVIPARFTRGYVPPPDGLPEWQTLFTAMFLHGGFLHVIGNMWYLWLFGDNVEDRLGRPRFLVFYLTCGLIASGVQILAAPDSRAPMIGASGAIAGVLGAYLVLFPRAMIRTVVWFVFFIQVVRVPAVFFLGFWILLQLVQGVGSSLGEGAGTSVAWFAHLGGFVAGVLLIRPFTVGRPPPSRQGRFRF